MLYKIIRTITSKSTKNLFLSQKAKFNTIKEELHSKQIQSLVSQMYSAENENLFI
jgi:hypothetical protein